jgi:tetratricopeptide (TPR) repeat protein
MSTNKQSHYQTVLLRNSKEFCSREKPTVSLAILAKPDGLENTQLAIEVIPHVDEVVIVAVDISRRIVDSWKSHPLMTGKVSVVEINSTTHPELYFKDEAESYSSGESLLGESFKGPFTGRHIIADWSKVRNLGWKRCTQEWRLSIDSDEELSNGEYISSLCHALNSSGCDLANLLSVRPVWNFASKQLGQVITGRLAKNGCPIGWTGETRELLEGGHSPAIIDGSLQIRQGISSFSAEAALDCFKTLYANARLCNWNIAPCNLLYMAQLAHLAGMSEFAGPFISAYLESSLYTEERAWACALRGQQFETNGNYEQASAWYERSLLEHPGFKSAYRLCRVRHLERKWEECLAAFRKGCENNYFRHMVDDGVENNEQSLILATSALIQLGRMDEAEDHGKILRLIYPDNRSVIELCDSLGRKSKP